MKSVRITPDGTRILSGSGDRTVRVWEAGSGRELAKLEGHTGEVWSVAALGDNTRALSAGTGDKTLRLWDLATGRCLKTIECEKEGADAVFSVDVHRGTGMLPVEPPAENTARMAVPPGTRVVSGHHDGRVRLWDLAAGKCLATLTGHADTVTSVRITPDGRFAVSGSDDKTVKVWDLEAAACVGTLEGHQENVLSVAISPDGALIASTGFNDETLRIWDLKSDACLQVIHVSEPTPFISVAFSPNGTRLIAGGASPPAIYVYRLTGVRAAPPADGTRRYVNAKVVLLGEGTVGKTSLAHRSIEDQYVVKDRTHGLN